VVTNQGVGSTSRKKFNASGASGAETQKKTKRFTIKLTLPHNLEFDTGLYYVDNVPQRNVSHYLRADIRLGWKPISDLDLSLGIRNLFDKQHREFGDVFSGNTVIASEVPRTFYLQLKYQFE